MGTNFYWTEAPRPCPTCGHDPARTLHIGKSSAGWCFALNTHPDAGITSLDDWVAKWKSGGEIRDEYHGLVSIAEMLDRITNRSWDGHRWTSHNLVVNHAATGPNGLARHKVGRGCIAHGDGTYDLMQCEFS